MDDVALVLTTRDDRTVRVVYRKTTKFLLDDRPVTAASLKIGDSITVRARPHRRGSSALRIGDGPAHPFRGAS